MSSLNETDIQETSKTVKENQLFTPGRITNLCDGVFSIVMTILVLNLKIGRIDDISSLTLKQEMLRIFPRIGIYIVVFILLGFFWLANHRIFEYIRKVDKTFLWINIFFLMFVSILPFFTDLVNEFENYPIVVALFCAIIFIIELTIFIKWRYATHNYRLIDKSLPCKFIRYRSIDFLVALIIVFISIPSAFLNYHLPFLLLLMVPIIIWLLNRLRNRKLTANQTVKTN